MLLNLMENLPFFIFFTVFRLYPMVFKSEKVVLNLNIQLNYLNSIIQRSSKLEQKLL